MKHNSRFHIVLGIIRRRWWPRVKMTGRGIILRFGYELYCSICLIAKNKWRFQFLFHNIATSLWISITQDGIKPQYEVMACFADCSSSSKYPRNHTGTVTMQCAALVVLFGLYLYIIWVISYRCNPSLNSEWGSNSWSTITNRKPMQIVFMLIDSKDNA